MNHTNQNQKQQPDAPLIIFFTLFVIIAIGLFSKLTSPQNKAISRNPPQLTQSSPLPPAQRGEKQLDIMKPLKCEFANKESSYSAQMKGDTISVISIEKSKTMKVVVLGDCVYRWEEGDRTGTKRCGIGSALKVGKQLIGSGLVKIDTILPYIQKLGAASFTMQDPSHACLNTDVIDDKQFIVPKNVQFTVVKEIK